MKPMRVDGGDNKFLYAAFLCFGLAAVCAALIFLFGCSHSGKALNVAVVGAGVADLVTTRQVINGGGYEVNPLAGDGAVRQALLKAGSATGVIGIAQLLNEKGHPILAHLVRSTAVVLWSAASVSNYRIARSGSRCARCGR